MDSDRCPSCAAAVKPGAPWCTLCYADLRPAPVRPVEARVAVPAGGVRSSFEVPADAQSAALAELTALTESPGPTSRLGPMTPATANGDPGVSLVESPLGASDDELQASWPCIQCGAAVPLTEMACKVCGGAFLKGLAEPSFETEVPGLSRWVRRYQAMSKGERLAAVFGLGLAVSLGFVALLAVVGILAG